MSQRKKVNFFLSLSFLIIFSLFNNSLTLLLHPVFLCSSPSVPNCVRFSVCVSGCNLVIAWCFRNPPTPDMHTHIQTTIPKHITSPFMPAPCQVGCLGCPGGNIRWPGTPQWNPESSGRTLLTVSFLLPPSFLYASCFQVQGKVKALRMHSLDFTTRQAGGAVLCSLADFIYSFTSSCSLIFISLAQAFTEINTGSKVRLSDTAIY